jgi:integrative and conjugative element protein (TIGR02256 family)
MTGDTVPRLSVRKDVEDFLCRKAISSPALETGGILMGFHNGRDILVTKASDAGPNAQRSRCGCLRDTAFCQQELDEEHAKSGADYIGEWHTHVVDLRGPSHGDLQTLSGIVLDDDYVLPSFAMLLVIVSTDAAELLGYVAYRERESPGQHSVAISAVTILHVA